MNIKKVSDLLGLSSDTIRYYERVGLIPPVHRNHAGNRDFGERDVAALELVRCFRSAGVSVESLIDYISLCQDGDNQHLEERRAILIVEREKLQKKIDELSAAISRLDYKIDNYEKIMVKEMKSMKNAKQK
ncbi:MerR family transcriptional regulator [Streptococcus azizii]|uniref:MerR family transcriptional regulator n=1 Tax=Streptococcus azizii TaxID=1579424 RepID=A0AB36JLL8_9STRE|nr:MULTISPECIES: stress response transcriptional regulator NmlR [Streptococcus]MBF0776135.1 MerR family transcriptional regulator [Streptococcus sp. 19428wD3_AN2]ONK26908.1 MerR family transcriptional regulator [Streptococcus azizii]ONK27930.1 MerR family transcriptional regulator [Streptococcus azizii]ONK28774.1 MerR family transcriptional regulator [Streptococcus azizii]TFU83480.1 MerR family transcriptional regulator [Streptococcus sp. AN2]